VSNLLLYYSPRIREQYAIRNNNLTPTVQFNDVTFAGHALVLSLIIISQYSSSLWGWPPSTNNRPSRFILGVAFGSLVAVASVALLVISSSRNQSDVDPRTSWCALDIVYAMSYVKLLITLIKYAPQIATNYRNRSTKGWSIVQILLDISGGVLSISQQAIDSYLQRDWSGITGNPVKFALGNISIMYDLIFIAQHFLLYAPESGKSQESEDLLESDDSNHRRLD
jgi:cystinosin